MQNISYESISSHLLSDAIHVGQNVHVVHNLIHTRVHCSFFPDSLQAVLGIDENDKRFSSLADVVSDKTLQAIQEMGFTEMMEIQHKSIRPLLQGQLVCFFLYSICCTCNDVMVDHIYLWLHAYLS